MIALIQSPDKCLFRLAETADPLGASLQALNLPILNHVEEVTWVALAEHVITGGNGFGGEHVEQLQLVILVQLVEEFDPIEEPGVNPLLLKILPDDDVLEDAAL